MESTAQDMKRLFKEHSPGVIKALWAFELNGRSEYSYPEWGVGRDNYRVAKKIIDAMVVSPENQGVTRATSAEPEKKGIIGVDEGFMLGEFQEGKEKGEKKGEEGEEEPARPEIQGHENQPRPEIQAHYEPRPEPRPEIQAHPKPRPEIQGLGNETRNPVENKNRTLFPDLPLHGAIFPDRDALPVYQILEATELRAISSTLSHGMVSAEHDLWACVAEFLSQRKGVSPGAMLALIVESAKGIEGAESPARNFIHNFDQNLAKVMKAQLAQQGGDSVDIASDRGLYDRMKPVWEEGRKSKFVTI